MKSSPIYLPFDNGSSVRVYVTPYKMYGNNHGIYLINKYSKRHRDKPQKQKCINSIIWKDKNNGITINSNDTIAKGKLNYILSLDALREHTQELIKLEVNNHTLNDNIRLGKARFNRLSIIQILEEIFKCKILSRRDNRLLKRMLNTIFEFSVFVDYTDFKPMVICGKSEGYIVTPNGY